MVDYIRDGRRRLTPIGGMPILSGMLFCADCGAKLYQVRARGWKHEQEYFTCASYRKGQGLCSPHQIHNVQVEEILLRQLKSITAYARSHEMQFVELEAAIAEAREQHLNVDSFLGMVRRYTGITELTAEIIRSFVENIEVKKPEKVPGTRAKKQTLVIWWNFIGVVDIPQQEQKETA